MAAIIKFFSKNWVPITAGSIGVVLGWFGHQTKAPQKTGSWFKNVFVSTGRTIKSWFTRKKKDDE